MDQPQLARQANAVAKAVRRLKKHLRDRPTPAPDRAVPHAARAGHFSV